MLNQLRFARHAFPRQFWLLFWGMLISTIGASMIWPFLMIYVSEKLSLPLTAVASLMTLNSVMGLLFSFMAGPVIDRAGRKWVMVGSLVASGLVYLFLSRANTLLEFAILQAVAGAVNPLYRVGADAMMADLVPADDRVEAYSLMRLSNNVGVAIGPAVGGFIASTSYTLAFYCAMTGLVIYGLMMAFLGRETLPARDHNQPRRREPFGGYLKVFRDRDFSLFAFAFTLTQVGSAILWVLLSVYLKHNFGIPEKDYGWLPTTNALLIVFFQMQITAVSRRYRPLSVLAIGTIIYATAVGSIALGMGFWAFWASMVWMTLGEMILMPTSTTYAANLAPADMRGRYMSIYGLTWGVGQGIGPVLGGFLSDQFGPHWTWYGGFLIGMVGAVVFTLLTRRSAPRPSEVEAE